MNNSSFNLEKACHEFIDEDDNSLELIKDLKKIKSLKSNVTDRLAKVIKDLGVVRNIFKNHEQRQKSSNSRPLKKGASFFEKICTLDLDQVEQGIKEEIQAVESEIEEARKGREQRKRERLAEFFMRFDGGAIFRIAADKAKAETEAQTKIKRDEERALAAKSIRKLKQFGKNGDGATFAWPSEADIISMPTDQPAKVVSFNYRIYDNRFITQIQVNLSNGKSSPLFAASETDELSELKTLRIQDIAQVKRVQGTENSNRCIRQLIFKTAGGAEVGRMQGQDAYLGPEDAVLSEGEEIIGVYGQHDDDRLGNISLLVWRPNKI